MKIFSFWFVSLFLLLALGALPLAQGHAAAEEGASRRQQTEVNGGRELLVQQIRVDRADLQMDGELVLRTLSPLSGELRLQRAQGEPKQIIGMLMRLLPGVKSSFEQFFALVDVQDLTLRDLLITVTAEGYRLQLASAEIAEGGVQQVTGWMDQRKNWQVESGPLHLRHLPLRAAKGMALLPVSYKRLQGSGERQELFSLEAERIKVGHLAMIADPEKIWGEVLRRLGFARGLMSSPIVFERIASKWTVDARQVATQMLLLQAPGGSASGSLVMPWQPEPRQLHVRLDVTSSARHAESKAFQTVVPVVFGQGKL
ncbi:hypothetical protein [Candidatus Magnetaquicoccus inordinatus]|uniref:hypothetical protein n=1 Tax=Candidatus Magnetaquicoccus inordinatus TaxID=2496818 RepID=UPI00102D15CA|nr:hypothetical protein [Candidatus Magnetaquicoccus inordinatus]